MTANRALRELRDEGVLVRIAGVGSFVADRHARAHPLEIRSIAERYAAEGTRTAPKSFPWNGCGRLRNSPRISALHRAASCIVP